MRQLQTKAKVIIITEDDDLSREDIVKKKLQVELILNARQHEIFKDTGLHVRFHFADEL